MMAVLSLVVMSSQFTADGAIPAPTPAKGPTWRRAALVGRAGRGQEPGALVDDPDAPDPKAPKMTWVHWVLYDLPPTATSLPAGVKQGDAAAGHARSGSTTGSSPAGAARARPSDAIATSSSSTRSTPCCPISPAPTRPSSKRP